MIDEGGDGLERQFRLLVMRGMPGVRNDDGLDRTIALVFCRPDLLDRAVRIVFALDDEDGNADVAQFLPDVERLELGMQPKIEPTLHRIVGVGVMPTRGTFWT